LFAEVLHLQYLFTSSPLFDALVQSPFEGVDGAIVLGQLGVADGLSHLSDRFVEEKIMTSCIVVDI
jgi:hypothetical protein